MDKLIITFLIVLFIFVATLFIFAPSKATSSEIIVEGNYYFTADWCPACQDQGKVIKELQKRGYVIKVYNVDEGTGPFKDITVIPLLIIVKIDEKGRQLILKLKGKQPIRKLIKVLIKENDQTPGGSL